MIDAITVLEILRFCGAVASIMLIAYVIAYGIIRGSWWLIWNPLPLPWPVRRLLLRYAHRRPVEDWMTTCPDCGLPICDGDDILRTMSRGRWRRHKCEMRGTWR